jgi:hypothetical protein
MKSVSVSEFKSGCIAILKQVQKTGQPLVVTWRGQPLAEVRPPREELPAVKLGHLKGAVTIRGDLVHPDWAADWDERRHEPLA